VKSVPLVGIAGIVNRLAGYEVAAEYSVIASSARIDKSRRVRACVRACSLLHRIGVSRVSRRDQRLVSYRQQSVEMRWCAA